MGPVAALATNSSLGEKPGLGEACLKSRGTRIGLRERTAQSVAGEASFSSGTPGIALSLPSQLGQI